MTDSDTPSDNFDKYRDPDEMKLIGRVISGEKKAVVQLFEQYRGMILNISDRYVEKDISEDKLIFTGNQGLLKAVKRFHDTVGINYSAYAAWWIRESIMEYRPNA